MKWEKIGLVSSVIEKISWSDSHAQVPTLLLKEDRLRVYFATRPRQDLSLTTFCDLDLNNLNQIIYVHDRPILGVGIPGAFDQHGIMPSSVVNNDGLVHLYYSGWCRSVGVPYNNYTGLALSEDGGLTFQKKFEGPIIDRTPLEIFSATSPEVYRNGQWHMYYCSGTNWHKINEKFEHSYDIKYATSVDGITWKQTNKVIIPQQNPYEAITKPTVLNLDGKYHMWFCYRGSFNFRSGEDAYRIGYAVSTDLITWERRDDEAGISLSTSGWDSQMIAYPAVVRIGKEIYMFYNGNNFGKEGFGFARLIY